MRGAAAGGSGIGPVRRLPLIVLLVGSLQSGVTACARGREAPPAALTRALQEERFTVGRLVGQTAWNACAVTDSTTLVVRTACVTETAPGTRRARRLDQALERAREWITTDTSAAALHASALVDLRYRQGSPAALDRAVRSLERALHQTPRDAALLNDLAVASIALAERDQQLRPMLRALDLAERAVSIDSTLRAAQFNRALVLERLQLRARARQAWAHYDSLETAASWKSEAAARLRSTAASRETPAWDDLLHADATRAVSPEAVTAQVLTSPQTAREFCFGTLLAAWGEAALKGDSSRAARLLGAARSIAEASDRGGLDRSVALAVEAIDAALEQPQRSLQLARAFVDFGAGFSAYQRGDVRSAAPLLARSEQQLRQLGVPTYKWALFYRAAALMAHAADAAVDSMYHMAASEATAEEPALRGKAIWAEGVVQLRRANYESALRRYREAAPSFTRTGEVENEGAISYLISEALNLAGQTAAGDVEAYRGLRTLSGYRESSWLNQQLTTVAAYARAYDYRYAALAVMNEVLEVARTLPDASYLAWALRSRAADELALHRPAAARATLQEAMRAADRIAPGDGRDRVRADIDLVRAQAMRDDDARGSEQLLERVVAEYRQLNLALHVPTALYQLSLAANASGDTKNARLALLQAIELIEGRQPTFQTAEVRATFYETVENVFDAMIRLELAADHPAEALQYLERGRVAAWPDAAMPGGGLTLAALRRQLPDSMMLIEYALLDQRLEIWTVTRRGQKHFSADVSRDSVAALVEGYTQAMAGKRDADALAARLHDLLIAPFASELAGIDQLTIVPDRELNRLPFSALRDARSRSYVLEHFAVRMEPSAWFYLAAAAHPKPEPATTSALVIGNPAQDGTLESDLPDLPGADAEARAIANLYERKTLLTDTQATASTFLALLPAHSVVHFAGHAVLNEERPERSFLALAADTSGNGMVSAREIGGLRLSNVKLVVLSACSTLSPRASRTGPVAGLAYSFLRAGTPRTVSTLWDIGDAATKTLLIRFHESVARGMDAVAALRDAQLAALHSADPGQRRPWVWAAFTYTGS